MATVLKVTRPRKAFWNGRPGEVFEYRCDRLNIGRRVVVHRWLDTGEVEVKACRGDGRTSSFRTYGRIDLPPGYDGPLMGAVNRCLETLPKKGLRT